MINTLTQFQFELFQLFLHLLHSFDTGKFNKEKYVGNKIIRIQQLDFKSKHTTYFFIFLFKFNQEYVKSSESSRKHFSKMKTYKWLEDLRYNIRKWWIRVQLERHPIYYRTHFCFYDFHFLLTNLNIYEKKKSNLIFAMQFKAIYGAW